MERKGRAKYLAICILLIATIAFISIHMCVRTRGSCKTSKLKLFTAPHTLVKEEFNNKMNISSRVEQHFEKDEGSIKKESPLNQARYRIIKTPTLSSQKIKSTLTAGEARLSTKMHNENIHKARYRLKLNAKCPREKDVYLVTVVESAPGSFTDRQQFRDTWGSVKETGGKYIHTVFLLGAAPNVSIQSIVEKESAKYGDIVQYDFVDTYRNLTVKTVAALRWVLKFCSHAKTMMKTDIDVIVQYSLLVDFLQSLALKTNGELMLYLGCVLKHMPPVRATSSKWFVSEQEYAGHRYPDYVAGWGYLLSLPAVKSIVQAALQLPYHPMEDVFVGIAAEKAGVAPTQNKWFAPVVSMGYSFCYFKPFLVIHLPGNRLMRLQFWLDLKQFENDSCSHVNRGEPPEHVCQLP
ncbi:beta-1,3-galactosyltransferase 5-like [Lingula anatina]|uniref:Hexosyltransferase n=1 Tax=Lingula anatina TaxID=7574 RepID=A0A1S3H2P8_LINAN|nr:beta-1,3-galactosyltransferase 5-like [Lingula anatina]|eukprot:XP_013379414.1 beta-1,3-galactosyltransferase 5-like [Lingula anatina]